MADTISLRLPPLSETDPLFAKKKNLLNLRNITTFDFKLQISCSLLPTLDRVVEVSRILNLNEIELYFVEDGDSGPFSPRNEIEALNSIILIIDNEASFLAGAGNGKSQTLEELRVLIVQLIESNLPNNEESKLIEMKNFDSHPEELLLKWGLDHGVQTKLKISHFEGAGRGAVALEDIYVGETALEVPESFIISEGVLIESKILNIFKKSDGINVETMLLLWSMKERFDFKSKYKVYFGTLPQEFNTGLSFGIEALGALDGTILFGEIMEAKEHLRKQYEELCPVLYTKHPEVFPPEFYTWDRFLWACELWYSNSMKVVFSDGSLRTCLLPVAGLLNHSISPHILHYGKVDPVARTLKFKLSKPCKAGEQCYLSYGNHTSSHFLTFYGFMPRGNNPYDVIPLDFEDSGERCCHMVRGTWLSKKKANNMPPSHGLPSPLLAYFHDLLSNEPNVVEEEDRERFVFETMKSTFETVMEGLEFNEFDEYFNRENCSWDLKLALECRDLQRRIMSSVLSSCDEALKIMQKELEKKDFRKKENLQSSLHEM